MLSIHTLRALKDNFVYAVKHQDGRCAIVDPGEADPVDQFLAAHNGRLEVILCTHHHWDHIQAVPTLVKKYGSQVWGSVYDSNRLPQPNRPMSEGAIYELFGEPLQILEVPGHTLGQIAFHLPNQKALFVGDTLFSAGCGRLFEGTADMMFSSLAKIKTLPTSTRIFFGHEYTLRNLEFVQKHGAAGREDLENYLAKIKGLLANGAPSTPSTLAEELLVNPFLRAASAAEFAHWRELRNHW